MLSWVEAAVDHRPPPARAAGLGATFPAVTATLGQVFLSESLITFILVFTIFSVATDERANAAVVSLAIGFALGVAVLIGGSVSGGWVVRRRFGNGDSGRLVGQPGGHSIIGVRG